jgi:hypothetical protein
MVVEVTAIQSGTVTNTSGDGVGLILRALPDLSDFLAFTIQHNGDWQLQHFHYVDDNPADNWTTIDDSYQPVTSTPTGPNHLMAVLHGSTIILYVNGHQVATEPNTFTSVSWLSSGLAGVYLDDTRLVGDFTDYAVYALPPQDLHSAVMRAVPWLGWLW